MPTNLTCRPSFSATARSSSLSNPVNWPWELMQMLGGASDSVPTVSVPGRAQAERVDVDGVQRLDARRRVLVLAGTRRRPARLVGKALALSTPGGAH